MNYNDHESTNGECCSIPEKLNVAVLASSYDDSQSIFKQYNDLTYDLEVFNPKPGQYRFDLIKIKKANAWKRLYDITRLGKYDLFLNLCDGSVDEDYAGIEVVEYLEKSNLPFISASSDFYSISKRHMKYVANISQIMTPNYFFVFEDNRTPDGVSQDRIEKAAANLSYPLFVKHHNGSGSVGLSKQSKVNDFDSLIGQVRETVKQFGGALVEEFVTGREFTVLVAENADDAHRPITYQPFECVFTGGAEVFKDFDLKMIEFDSLSWQPVLDDALCTELKNISAKIFMACGGNSFARCDYRMCHKTGQIYFLEINPQCGVGGSSEEFNSADYILAYGKDERPNFALNLIKGAFFKWRMNKKNRIITNFLDFSEKRVKLKTDVPRNFVLADLTEFSHNLVSRADADQWPKIRRRILAEKSIKIDDGLFLEINNRDGRAFDLMAFKRGSRALANVIVDKNLRLVTIRKIDAGQTLILEHNETIDI